jgi:hypothetical protein
VITLAHSTTRFINPPSPLPYNFPTPFNPNQRFRVENVLEELDQPGEWCWDSQEGKLYFWPPDADIGQAEVVAPALDSLLMLRGAAYITISGMTLTETNGGDNFHPEEVEGVGAMFAMPGWKSCGDAVLLDAAEHCRIEHNRLVNLGGNAIYLKGPSSRKRDREQHHRRRQPGRGHNLLFDVGDAAVYLETRRKDGYEMHSRIADPLFVDPAKDDYRLKPGSPAIELGFQPIDTGQIGVRRDASE